jgi:hypothetical protein
VRMGGGLELPKVGFGINMCEYLDSATKMLV